MAVSPKVGKEFGKYFVQADLISAAAATTNIFWVRVAGNRPVAIDVSGTFVGTVQIYSENSDAEPAATGTFPQIGSNATAAKSFTSDRPITWVGASVTAFTSGTISVSVRAG